MYQSKEEVLKSIHGQYSKSVDKIVALFASESVLNVIMYKENEVHKAFIVVKNENEIWEVIDNAQSELVAQFYVAYISGLLEIMNSKYENDELDATYLFN